MLAICNTHKHNTLTLLLSTSGVAPRRSECKGIQQHFRHGGGGGATLSPSFRASLRRRRPAAAPPPPVRRASAAPPLLTVVGRRRLPLGVNGILGDGGGSASRQHQLSTGDQVCRDAASERRLARENQVKVGTAGGILMPLPPAGPTISARGRCGKNGKNGAAPREGVL